MLSNDDFSDTLSQRESIQKHYFYDNGILNLFLISPETKLLENLVAINLYRQYGSDLYYYNHEIEVDFYVPSSQLGIQVSYDMTNTDTRQREISALLKLNSFKPLRRMIVITYNEENTVVIDNHTIEIIPVWKWLLM